MRKRCPASKIYFFSLFFFFKLLKYKSQQRSMQIMCHMQVHCIYMCFLPLPAYFDPFISFYRFCHFAVLILKSWGVFFLLYMLFYSPLLQVVCSEIIADGHSLARAGQAVVVKTQKIQQDKLKVHLKDKEESWIIESPTLIRTVKRARRSHHIGLTFPVTLLLLCCAAHHFHKGIRYSYT